MPLKGYHHIVFSFVVLLIFPSRESPAQSFSNDSLPSLLNNNKRYENFYDTLKVKAGRKPITKLLYDLLISDRQNTTEKKETSQNEFAWAEGKIVGKIDILRLDVFGPGIQDTTIRKLSWLEKAGNQIHTRSDLNNLRKNLVVQPGDILQSAELYDNERIFRTLPRIRDARFIAIPDSADPQIVNLLLITQDRFSIGVSGMANGTESASLEVFNRNLFGVGHELTLRMVGHLDKKPYVGFESFYNINNINGNFLSISAGYASTYRKEGIFLRMEKPLIRVSDQWGYGITGQSYSRTYEIPELHRHFYGAKLKYSQLNLWGARNVQVYRNQVPHSQVTFSTQYMLRDFKKTSDIPYDSPQFFSGTRQYLFGITWSQRHFIRDHLVYGYGITEDIPKGFKNEIVWGIDDNEYGFRYYSHMYLSSGNLILEKPGYMFLYGGVSSFFRDNEQQQGMLEFGLNYISGLHAKKQVRSRYFFRLDYKAGLNRMDIEHLLFYKNNLIRGFSSDEVYGKKRLNMSLESVYFQKRDFYRFNIAFFTFIDAGVLGRENKPVFREDYYAGFGAGFRLHNESLVLKTILIRLAVYPHHPKDVGLLGFLVIEQPRQSFYSFQPGAPSPRIYE